MFFLVTSFFKFFLPSLLNFIIIFYKNNYYILLKGPKGIFKVKMHYNIKCSIFFNNFLVFSFSNLSNILFFKILLNLYLKLFTSFINDLIFNFRVVMELRGLHFRIYKFFKNSYIFMYGLSHFILFKFPSTIRIKCLNKKKTKIRLSSFNRQFLYEIASQLKHLHNKNFYTELGFFFNKEQFIPSIGKKAPQMLTSKAKASR